LGAYLIRLTAYFTGGETKAAENWHNVMDLLTVRYFHVIDLATPELLKNNAKGTDGKEHSGLDEEELKDDKNVIKAYPEALTNAINVVFKEPLNERPASARASSMSPTSRAT
jgi:hypothetical protein